MYLHSLNLYCSRVNCTNNTHAENKIKNTLPFTITVKKTKYLSIYTFQKHVQGLYAKSLMKEIKDDINKQACSLIGRLNVIKMSILPKLIYKFNAIPIKIPARPSLDLNKLILKITRRSSLVAQWLRIRLPMQGTRVRALVQEDPTCRRTTKPVRHNY